MQDKTLKEVYTAEVALIEARINDIKTRVQMIGRENRFASGFTVGLIKGFMIGLVISLTLFTLIFHYFFT